MSKNSQTALSNRIHEICRKFLINKYKSKKLILDGSKMPQMVKNIEKMLLADKFLQSLVATLYSKVKSYDIEYHLIPLAVEFLSPERLNQLFFQVQFEPECINLNPANQEMMDEMQHFITDKTPVQDLRLHVNQIPLLRRLDSLSRILSFKISKSACTAVTIHEGQLIVAANVSSSATPEEISTALIEKLRCLNKLINNCPSSDYRDILPFCQKEENIKEMTQLSLGTGVTIGDLQQSLAKLIHLVKAQNYPFAAEFVNALNPDNPIVILNPKKEDNKHYIVKTTFQAQTKTSELIQLSHVDKYALEKDIHAEQMIHYYVKKVKAAPDTEEKGSIGISKLCCATCYKVVSQHFTVRGTHQNCYEGTVNIDDGQRELGNSPYHGPTNTMMSHIFSPHQSINVNAQADAAPALSEMDIETTNLMTDDKPSFKFDFDELAWLKLRAELLNKYVDLGARGEDKAAQAMEKLIADLDVAVENMTTKDEFRADCVRALSEAHQELDIHRNEWRKWVVKITTALGIVRVLDYMGFNQYGFLATHSRELLDKTEQQLPELVVSAA